MKDDPHSLLGTDEGASAAAPTILPHDGLSVSHLHGLDETPFHADAASIAGFLDPDFQPFHFPESLRGLLRKEPVELEIAAAVATMADGHELIRLLDSQPERVPS